MSKRERREIEQLEAVYMYIKILSLLVGHQALHSVSFSRALFLQGRSLNSQPPSRNVVWCPMQTCSWPKHYHHNTNIVFNGLLLLYFMSRTLSILFFLDCHNHQVLYFCAYHCLFHQKLHGLINSTYIVRNCNKREKSATSS